MPDNSTEAGHGVRHGRGGRVRFGAEGVPGELLRERFLCLSLYFGDFLVGFLVALAFDGSSASSGREVWDKFS